MSRGLVVAALTTPVDQDGHPDYGKLERLVDRLCGHAVGALFPCASTGEYVHFSLEENAEILRCVARAAGGRRRLFAGVASTTLRHSLTLMDKARQLGYEDCVACPPYYYPLSQQEVLAFYRALCQAAEGMRVTAYHVPFMTTGITPETLKELLETTPLAGVKDSSADLKRIGHIVRMAAMRADFQVYTGTDDCLLGALVLGCHGSMTALAGSVPERIAALYEAWRSGDLREAERRQSDLLPLLSVADALPFPVGYKLVTEMTMGVPSESCLRLCDAEQLTQVRARIRAILKQWGESDESVVMAGH